MRHHITHAIAGAIALALTFTAAPAAAISDGVVDHEHPNVGALLVQPDLEDPGELWPVCSGALLTPTTFLTSAHCLTWMPRLGLTAENLRITFDVDRTTATGHLDVASFALAPGALQRQNDANDVAVLTLTAPVVGIEPIEVAPVGWLDDAAARNGLKDHSFTNVGYGVQPNEQGRPSFESDGMRNRSTSPHQALSDAYLWLNMTTTATGEGGSCFGDSGSPKFVGAAGEPDGNLVVAITFGGNRTCRGGNFNQRLDIPTIADFLAPYLAD